MYNICVILYNSLQNKRDWWISSIQSQQSGCCCRHCHCVHCGCVDNCRNSRCFSTSYSTASHLSL